LDPTIFSKFAIKNVGGFILQQLSSLGCEFQLVKKKTIKLHKPFLKEIILSFFTILVGNSPLYLSKYLKNYTQIYN
jgi:hypothetical protein